MLSLVATLALYEALVRRFDPVRFLFGMKPQPRLAEVTSEAA